jgi:hypothetical protein
MFIPYYCLRHFQGLGCATSSWKGCEGSRELRRVEVGRGRPRGFSSSRQYEKRIALLARRQRD